MFMSYSHDSDAHRDWVSQLARRLVGNGVNVVFDRWNLAIGGNLTRFMEQAGDEDFKVVAVISEGYTEKADGRVGGTGYEAQMLSAGMYEDLESDRVLPLLRNNQEEKLPQFLRGRLWVDFRDNAAYENSYEKLLRQIHDAPVEAAPALGANPFSGRTEIKARQQIRNSPERWQNPGMSGEVEFVYSQNSGEYRLGSGECQFTLKVTTQGTTSVYGYRDPHNVARIANINDWAGRRDLLSEFSQFDTSSRTVDAGPGDAIVLNNTNGYWAAVCVKDIFTRQDLNFERVIAFDFVINTRRTADFTDLLWHASDVPSARSSRHDVEVSFRDGSF
ncbi:hypothetical protein BJF89_17190 [Corynebacterium sp. CNJ-954]|nr:hypothetical protein BJF89_17190 [Corynebacterium sp. CNJ-954]